MEGRRDQRSPLRRCFKPRPPLSAGCAGFASGCRLSGSELKRPILSPLGLESLGFESRPHSGRLSGLLSGCPPTGTRPQARAKLGNSRNNRVEHAMQEFFCRATNFSRARTAMVTRVLAAKRRAVFLWSATKPTRPSRRGRCAAAYVSAAPLLAYRAVAATRRGKRCGT